TTKHQSFVGGGKIVKSYTLAGWLFGNGRTAATQQVNDKRSGLQPLERLQDGNSGPQGVPVRQRMPAPKVIEPRPTILGFGRTDGDAVQARAEPRVKAVEHGEGSLADCDHKDRPIPAQIVEIITNSQDVPFKMNVTEK